LQQACLNDSIPCSSLLLKAYAIAMKLGMKDTAEVFSHELNGYKDADKNILPEYRRVLVNTEAYDAYYDRWIPVTFPSKSKFNKHSVVESITEIEKIDQTKCDTLEVRLNADAQMIIHKVTNMTEPMLVHQIFAAAQATSILQKVRKVILDWSLELESKGILGENLEFSDAEQKKAKNMPSIQIINNGIISNSNMAAELKDSISSIQTRG
jgi:hypothetical protein